MGNNCCRRRKLKRKIVLLLVGLDNAGKTRAVNRLLGDASSPVPTIGFSVINLKYLDYIVKVFDLGGGPSIRGIWYKYFVDAHGIIYVIDSSDFARFNETKIVLEDLLSNEKIAGKPLLILANKQDDENALDEIDVIEYLNIEQLVNNCQCPTLVQSCSASEQNSHKIDPAIQKGYEWLLNNVIKNYENLNSRVERDVIEQENKERQEMLEKIQRIKDLQEKEQSKKDVDAIESYSDYARKLNGEIENNQILNSVTLLDSLEIESGDSELSEDSSITFPPVYHINYDNCALPDRPKSAVQIVKHQLQLNSNIGKNSLKLKLNKTAPINLYGVKLPHSAKERRKEFTVERRNLKSADDRLFMCHSKIPSNLDLKGSSGDNIKKNNVQLNNLDSHKKLPPLNIRNKGNSWVHKPLNGDNVISVIDID